MSARQDGYTILEALCAFAILSVVLVALYGAGGNALRALTVSTDADRVALFAQSKLDEFATMRTPLPAFQVGEFQGTDVRWRLETQEIAKPDRDAHDLHLQTVKLVLNWPALVGVNEYAVNARHIGIEKQ
jgi:type II secretory pathway pseudopilin PulG